MFKMRDDTERIVAVLHDVVEDSEWTLDDLRDEGFPDETLVAVDHLTRREQESYEDFIERASANSLARTVKIADLQDNMDVSRISQITDKDVKRIKRYQRALARLSESGAGGRGD